MTSILPAAALGQVRSYRPSTGTEGRWFIEQWCGKCQRDAKYRETQNGEDGCPIVAASLRCSIDEPDYPKEWVQDEDGSNPRCTAFETLTGTEE